MSDATIPDATPAAVAPPDDKKRLVDGQGRIIVLRELDPADTLDLMEAAGSAADNAAWFRMAVVIASVASINGIPLPKASKKTQVLQNARDLGTIGLYAVTRHMFPKVAEGADDAAAETMAERAAAKN